MRNIMAIIMKEIRIYFTTPLAFVVLTVFAFVSSFFFLRLLGDFQRQVAVATQMNPEMLQYMNFTDRVLVQEFANIAVIFVFVVPVLSMRLIAEERRTRTFELLRSNPVTPLQIVIGKYFAALVIVFIMVAVVAIYPLLVWAYSDVGGPAWATVFTGLLGLLLLGATFMSVGLLVSSMTKSQAIAWFITWCLLMLLWMVGWAASDASGVARDILSELSAIEHIRGFVAGRIHIKDTVYYVSLTGLGLFLSHRALEAQQWH